MPWESHEPGGIRMPIPSYSFCVQSVYNLVPIKRLFSDLMVIVLPSKIAHSFVCWTFCIALV